MLLVMHQELVLGPRGPSPRLGQQGPHQQLASILTRGLVSTLDTSHTAIEALQRRHTAVKGSRELWWSWPSGRSGEEGCHPWGAGSWPTRLVQPAAVVSFDIKPHPVVTSSRGERPQGHRCGAAEPMWCRWSEGSGHKVHVGR